MGQRLNIEIRNGPNDDDTLANCYYHWGGYSCSAAGYAELIIKRFYVIQMVKPNAKKDIYYAMALLRSYCEGFPDYEYESICKENLVPIEKRKKLPRCNDRNFGLMMITKEGIEETRKWEEARLVVDISNKVIDFHNCFWVDTKEEFEKDHEDEEWTYGELTIDPFEIPFDDFGKFCNQWVLNEDLWSYIYDGEPNVVYTVIA